MLHAFETRTGEQSYNTQDKPMALIAPVNGADKRPAQMGVGDVMPSANHFSSGIALTSGQHHVSTNGEADTLHGAADFGWQS